MPCADPKPMKEVLEMKEMKERERIQESIDSANERSEYLGGAFCALLTEIERRNLPLESILEEASKNGGIDLTQFWEEHKAQDRARLEEVLKKYSRDERDVLRQLLLKEEEQDDLTAS